MLQSYTQYGLTCIQCNLLSWDMCVTFNHKANSRGPKNLEKIS